MKSIQHHLVRNVVAAMLALSGIAGLALYVRIRSALIAQYDQALVAGARSVAAVIHREPDGKLDLNFTGETIPEYQLHGHGGYFELLQDDGKVIARSPSLAARELPRKPSSEDACWNLGLPDGRAGRGVALRFLPATEIDESPGKKAPSTPLSTLPPAAPLVLLLARDRAQIDATLSLVLSSLLATAAALAAGTAIAVTLAIRRGLAPLRRIGAQTEQIGAASLEYRFSLDRLPAELQPICQRLNDLLGRLGDAFRRERRFTANVAHELRTPIAELRSMAEVALKWPGDAPSAAQNFRDALDVAQHMETIVSALLEIARCEGGMQGDRLPVDACMILAEAWKPFGQRAQERGLKLDWHLPDEAVVVSDRGMLLALLSNLLSNAVEYTLPGSRIECRISKTPGELEVSVANTTRSLDEDDVPHLFEPFWRKDAARSGGTHYGIGLSLVAAYVGALGGRVMARFSAPDTFCIMVTFPRQSPPHSAIRGRAGSGSSERSAAPEIVDTVR